MKPNDIDPLDDLLKKWQVDAPTPVEFNRQVWNQIASDQSDIPWAESLLSWLLLPRRLAGAATLAILIGAIAGLTFAQAHKAEGKKAYFSAIDPLSKEHILSHVPASQP